MGILNLVLSLASCSGLPSWACDAQLTTGIDPELIHALCLVESNGNHKAFLPKDGKSASYGVCQIKLNTARHMGFKGTHKQLMEPSVNAHYAAKYLSYNILRYNSLHKGISAYNAGRAITSNSGYVTKVLKIYQGAK